MVSVSPPIVQQTMAQRGFASIVRSVALYARKPDKFERLHFLRWGLALSRVGGI